MTVRFGTDEEFVLDTPYLHLFDGLNSVRHQMETAELTDCMGNIGYDSILVAEYPLPNGKKLVQMDFKC